MHRGQHLAQLWLMVAIVLLFALPVHATVQSQVRQLVVRMRLVDMMAILAIAHMLRKRLGSDEGGVSRATIYRIMRTFMAHGVGTSHHRRETSNSFP